MSRITMKSIAVMSVQYVHYTFEYFLDSMKRCGLKNIELWGGIPHYYRLDYKTSLQAGKKIADMRRKMEDKGMKVAVYTPETLGYPYSFSSPEKATRKRTVEFFKMAMEDAFGFGTSIVFMNSGCGPLDIPREESWKRAADTISEIVRFYEKNGATVVIEQLQPYESNLLTTCPDMVRMLNDVNSPALQACIDLVAMEVCQEKLEDFCKALPGRIKHIHYADGNPSGHYILGDGNLPLKEYIKILEKQNYDRYLTLEINDSIYWDDPHTSIRRSAEYLRSFLPEE